MSDLIDREALMKKICGNECGSVCDEECEKTCNFYDYIMDAPAVNRWIPCSERLPEQTGYYLVCDSTAEFDNIKGRQDVSKYVIGRHGGHWYGAIRREHITHWMPLPELPKREV